MDAKELKHRFTYHTPTGKQPEWYATIRAEALKFAELVNELCPDSREKSLAITHLEDSVMWANASIARNPNG
jgi:hypothetical protein